MNFLNERKLPLDVPLGALLCSQKLECDVIFKRRIQTST